MKTLHQMLAELARPEVSEFAVMSDRLPCIKVGGKFEPIDDKARSTEAILEMLVSAGGSRYIDDMTTRPAVWTTRIEGLGSVGVQAIMKDGRVQARFSVVRRASVRAMPAQQAPAQGHARKSIAPANRSSRPSRKSMRAMAVATAAKEEEALERASDPHIRVNVHKPASSKPAPVKIAAAATPADAAALRSLDAVLSTARDVGASDVHVVAERPVLVRVGGELVPRGSPVEGARVEAMLAAIVPERLRATLEAQGSCDFAVDRGPLGRFRVNVAKQRTGLKGSFRLIAKELPTLKSLGLPPEIERATHHHQGLVLVTGPTGHGKTCTLAAIVDIINRETTHHVITVEDPVEYLHPRKKAMISQREVGADTRAFASALKASLREDPDVIVVGELRDTETVRMALAASETGHLVLGTMNTPSAAKTIDRLVDLFPPADQQQVRMTLAGGLHLIVSQRLVPSTDGAHMAAAVELLPGSVALWSLIRDGKTYQIPSLQQRGKGFGIIRLDESLYDLVRAGRVTKDAALAVAENPEELDAILSGRKPPPGAQPAVPPGAKPEGAPGLLGKAGQLFGRKG
ncbi:MAG TPA: PilT/PilU family type 4a pilus ATPase [Polyangiaceae bacterium]